MFPRRLKKTIFTLNINNHAPDVTELTYPLIKKYASKIGADFHVINSRRYPEWPITYEKLQIYELGREMQNDWNIYIDADALILPDFFDMTQFIPKDTVAHNGKDMANNRWVYDHYFWRDGRNIGICNWLAIASDWCLDLWHPLEDLTQEEALANIYPTINELNTIITKEHLIDDYTLSRNIAKYGLKYTTIGEIVRGMGQGEGYLWHQYTCPKAEKAIKMRKVLITWGLAEEKDFKKSEITLPGEKQPVIMQAPGVGIIGQPQLSRQIFNNVKK